MKEIDTAKLDLIIDKEGRTTTEKMLYRDLFAVACYLHERGEKTAGLKLIQTLFDQLGRNLRKTYLDSVVSNLPGNQRRHALAVCAHQEINQLFEGGEDSEIRV